MPNHVDNHVIITGKPAGLDALIAAVDGESPFDFERLLPMPSELQVSCGSTTIDGKSVSVWREVDGKAVAVPASEIVDWQLRFGATDWYTWCIENWGTKWNAYDVMRTRTAPGCVLFDFYTAWSEPQPIYRELARRFPNVVIRVEISGEVDQSYSTAYGAQV